jgi:hypothetical protein
MLFDFGLNQGIMHYLTNKEEMQDGYKTKTTGGFCRARERPDSHEF